MAIPVAAIIAAVPEVTKALDKVTGIFKGKTQHASFEAVNPVAESLATNLYNLIVQGYGESATGAIAREVRPLFLAQLKSTWGLDIPLNATIAKDVTANLDLRRQLWLFIIWVGTNIDVNRPETFNQYVDSLFRLIFVQGISNAGFDTSSVATVNASVPSQSTPSSTWLSNVFQGKTLLVIALIVIAYFAFFKKKR